MNHQLPSTIVNHQQPSSTNHWVDRPAPVSSFAAFRMLSTVLCCQRNETATTKRNGLSSTSGNRCADMSYEKTDETELREHRKCCQMGKTCWLYSANLPMRKHIEKWLVRSIISDQRTKRVSSSKARYWTKLRWSPRYLHGISWLIGWYITIVSIWNHSLLMSIDVNTIHNLFIYCLCGD